MPIYEYRCRDCETVFSVLTLSVSSPVEPVCTSCGGKNADKLVSKFAYHSDEGPIVDDPAEYEPPPPAQPFGRKELNEAIKQRGSST